MLERTLIVDKRKSDTLLNILLNDAAGPSEAYGILVLTIYRLNFEFAETPITIVELADECRQSIINIKMANIQ